MTLPLTSHAEIGATYRHLRQWALLSLAAAIVTLVLKFGAYGITGSIGLLSDAVESTANLVAAMTAIGAIWFAAKPADRTHPYGHAKIEFFASAVEGGLVLVAAVWIGGYAVDRFFHPQAVESPGVGAVIALVATAINFGVARVLLRQARDHDSVVLAADGKHLMTDVITSIAVVIGLLVTAATGIERLDAVIAMAVAVNIFWTGLGLLRVAFDGLMDRALPQSEQANVRRAVESAIEPTHTYHALRTRRAGTRRFVDLHVLVPGQTTVADAHRIANRIERAVDAALVGSETTVHVEPIEEPASWQDSPLLQVEPPTVPPELFIASASRSRDE